MDLDLLNRNNYEKQDVQDKVYKRLNQGAEIIVNYNPAPFYIKISKVIEILCFSWLKVLKFYTLSIDKRKSW